jgi:hypothetical protein
MKVNLSPSTLLGAGDWKYARALAFVRGTPASCHKASCACEGVQLRRLAATALLFQAAHGGENSDPDDCNLSDYR